MSEREETNYTYEIKKSAGKHETKQRKQESESTSSKSEYVRIEKNVREKMEMERLKR